jgi:hypothetical protein
MPGTDLVEKLRAARAEVEQACTLLLSPSPDTLGRCMGVFERACHAIGESRRELPGMRGDPVALAEAHRLRFAVRHAGKLLETAQEFHTRWNHILGAMTGGYTQSGDPAPVIRRGQVCLTG